MDWRADYVQCRRSGIAHLPHVGELHFYGTFPPILPRYANRTAMPPTLTIILSGCLLGAIQLIAGVAIGMWLRRPSVRKRDADLCRARSLALGLHGLTHNLGSAISEHQSRFEDAEKKLAAERSGKQHPTTDLVVGVVGEILKSNQQLQRELTKAEDQIASQLTEIESHLSNAMTDPLTGLPNRRALDDQLARRLEDYRKHGTPFSLLMIDADYFKQINDTFGHPVGDEVLIGIGKSLRGALRKHDFVARFGGEEFAVILPYTTLAEAQRAAGKVGEGLTGLATEFAHLDRTITASGGLASIGPGEDTASLVQRADEALYAAKQNGRDRTYLHDGNTCSLIDAPTAAGTPWVERVAVNSESAKADRAKTVTSGREVPARSKEMLGAVDDLHAALLEVADVE